MNPQHIHQNMGYLPLLAEEGLKVVNSFQGSGPLPPEAYHHPQTSSQQSPYLPQHYHVPDQGYHPQDRMQGMYSMVPGTSSPGEEMGMHGFLENRPPPGINPFIQPQYLPKSAAAPAPAEPKPKEKAQKAKKSKGGRPKKRKRDPKSWRRNQSKYLRNSGQQYINSNGCLMPARQLKEPCKNCRQRCTERITVEERQQIFDFYWDPTKDWTFRRMYIIDHAVPQPIQRRRASRDLDKKARRISFHYYLTVDGEQERVCKRYFLNTLGVGEKFVIISLHKKTVDGEVIPDRRGRHPASNQIPYEVKQEARRHIQEILANTPPEQVSLPKMYDAYCQQSEIQQKETVKKHFYRKLMNEELRINQQRIDDPDAVRIEERPLDYTPVPQVSALECLIKELWQKEQERRTEVKEKVNHKAKMKEYHALRYAGKEYVNFRGQVRPSRKMKPPCDNCQKGCTKHITEAQRQELFDQFWVAEKDWAEKKKYVLSCTEAHPVMNSRVSGRLASRAVKRIRSVRFTYTFEVDGEKVPVCRLFFVNTLALSHSFVANCTARKDTNGEPTAGKRNNKYGKLSKIPPAISKDIRQHIIYRCWADPNKSREYQNGSANKGWSWNVSKMYENYRQCCWNRGAKPASTYKYRRVFSEEMRIFQEMGAEVPSTPSTSTRGAGKKTGETDVPGEERAVKEKTTTPVAPLQSSKDAPAVHDENDSEEENENVHEALEEEEDESDEYLPSSDGEDDASDDDDDEEPPRKKSQTSVVPETSDNVLPETSGAKPTRMSEQHVSFSQPTVSGEKKKKRKRPSWDTADMRCAGQTYINDKGMVIPGRKIKEPCQNCRKQCSDKVPQEMREKIFNMFWSEEMTWDKKRHYMEDCIDENAVKKRTLPPSEMKLNRKVSMRYTLRLGDWEQNVCKLFFVNTLGISQKFAIVSMKKKKERQLKEMGLLTTRPLLPPPVPVSQASLPQGPMPQRHMVDPASLDNADNSLRDVLSHLLLAPANNMQQV